jgi:hypothetical protein
LTLSIPAYGVTAGTFCQPPATAMPSLSATGVCTDGAATFTISNAGGAMSADAAYTITDQNGGVVGSGPIRLEANASTTLSVTGVFGQLTLSIPEYGVLEGTFCQPPFEPPTPEPSVDLARVPVTPDLDADRDVRDQVRGIAAVWNGSGRPFDSFTLFGDDALLGVADVLLSTGNLDRYAGELLPIIQQFGTGLNNLPASYEACMTQPTLACFDAPIIFLAQGALYAERGDSPGQLRSELLGLVGELTRRGVIPVLVTIPGPVGDPTVAAYNTAIYEFAEEQRLPLFNLYAIGANNPSLISRDRLTDPGEGFRGDFSDSALSRFGLNVANLEMLRMLGELLGAIQ